MKKAKLLGLLVCLMIIIFPQPASAHLTGQPPFFKINGVYSNFYPVPTSSSPGFNLPQDLADKNYLVNQTLSFQIVTDFLPVPADIVKQTTFVWDFGDGTTGGGLTNTHTYTKPKSYILSITAQAPTDPQATLIETVMVNVLPYSDYKLPTSIIQVNGERSSDPLADILKANFGQDVNLDGTLSQAGSGKIASSEWDLGDTNSAANKLTLSYKYEDSLTQVFPVLRVTDQNGFISDSFVEVQNDPNAVIKVRNNATQAIIQKDPYHRQQLYTYIGGILIGILAAFVVIKWLRKNRARKRRADVKLD